MADWKSILPSEIDLHTIMLHQFLPLGQLYLKKIVRVYNVRVKKNDKKRKIQKNVINSILNE